MTAPVVARSTIPARPARSRFAMLGGVGAVVFTIVTMSKVGLLTIDLTSNAPFVDELSARGLIDFFTNWTNTNPVAKAIPFADWGQVTSQNSRTAFIETVQIAVLGTVVGSGLALPLALWSTDFGNPFGPLRYGLRTVNAIIRSIPDLIWASLFVAAVGIGALSGWFALIMFSLAVTTKLTADTLDGIDHGPIEAARAAGANNSQTLRTSVVPQILPAYASYVLYNFELNLRASAVIGLVGAGGIGERIQFYRGQGRWEEVWGIVLMFFLVVVVVEQISVSLRRRLV